MTKLEKIMKELNLKDELIESTMNKIEDACRNYRVKSSRCFSLSMTGNGNGYGDGDGDN